MSKLPFVSSTNNNSLNDLIEVIGFGFTFAETLKQAKADGGGVNPLKVRDKALNEVVLKNWAKRCGDASAATGPAGERQDQWQYY